MPTMSLRDLNYFHLRRLNQNKPGHDGKDNLILLVENTKFGRNPDMVDVVLTSAVYSNMISRNHAEILGKKNAQGKFDKYTISDSSLNGTYINDQRISNQPHELKEGDVIKFGHMNGAAVKPGQVAPQANAEFAFLVERAQAAHNYLGFDANGRRRTTVSCKGDVDSLTEIVPGTHPEAARITQSVNQTIPATATQPASSVPTISNSLPWSAGQFYGTSPAAPGTFQFPQALQFLNFNNATNPATANQFMSMLGARNQQLDPQWAAAMQCSIQMQPRLATAAQLQQAAAQQVAFGGNPYQTPPSTSASFLPPSALDNRLATSTNATQQANLAFNMQQNSALVNSILQQQQQQQFVQSQQATSQPTSVVQQTGQPHVAVQNPPQIKTEPPTPTLPTATIKPQVGSPPMECDSSVPSPPKVTATPVAPQPTTAIPRAPSPRQTSSDQDQRSEKSWSMVDSPPMPRAPAPSHANRELSRTPSPKSDTPEAEKEAAREKERERREKEEKEREKEEREKERKRKDDEEEKRRKEREREQREARERLKAAEAKAKANKGGRKGSEIARLINDLEGSFMTSARGSDLREQRKSLDGRKEDKDYKEEFSPPPQPKKEKEKEKERPKQSGRASKSEKSSTAASTPSEKSAKTESTAKQQNKLLKQLSDVSSVSSSSDSEVDKKKKKTPTTSNKKTSSASQSKKEAPKRRPATPASDSSDSDSDTDSLSSLDDSHVRAKGSTAKKARRNSTPKASKPSKPKTPIMPPKKRGRKPKSQGSSSSEESPEPEPMYPPPDPNVVFHDPIETCAMEKECNRPQTQNVNWVACDDCEKWYHAICILGKEDITGLDEFTCGCKEKKTKKKKVR